MELINRKEFESLYRKQIDLGATPTEAVEDAFMDCTPVDAVPVVRCKDCKHRHWYQEPCHGKTVHVCSELDAEVTTDFFCAAGERRVDNE